MSLRDQVETLLPNWQSWYPSVFDAAVDLGLIRARVCAPGSLLLSQRHASVYNEALQAFREKWSVVEPEGDANTESGDPLTPLAEGQYPPDAQAGHATRRSNNDAEIESDADRVMRQVLRFQPRRR